jgi:hypothetical protein
MTDEALFYRRFVEDVRSCAGGRAPASVAEIERRIRVALIASPSARERRWARVVAAVNELLAGLDRNSPPAERLRAFARENADLSRPRDVAITDFCFVPHAETIVTTREGRSYLLFTRIARVLTSPPLGSLDEIVPAGTRRVAEWTVYALCGGAALAALWFAFIVPV